MSTLLNRGRKAAKRIVRNTNQEDTIVALLGRISGDPQFVVTGKADWLYVRIKLSNGASTTAVARNDAGVPHILNLRVLLEREDYLNGVFVYVITGVSRRPGVAYAHPPSPSGIPPHLHDDRYFRENEHIDVSTGAADAGKPVKTNPDGVVDSSLIDTAANLVEAVNDAADIGAPVGADKVVGVDSITGLLGWWDWTTIQAWLTGIFSGLYVALTGAQSVAGAKEFTDDLTRREVGGAAQMFIISDGSQAAHNVISYRASATGGFMGGYGARGTEASPAVSQQNDRVFSFSAFGWSAAANAFVACGQINFIIDGSPDTAADPSDMPGRIQFHTTPEGGGAPVLALTLDNAQLATFAKFLVWAGQKRVSTQFDKTNTTLATVTGLSVTVEAGKSYYFEATLHITADATGGHKVAIAGTATATAIIYQIESLDNGTDALVIANRQTALAGSAGQAGATEVRCVIRGEITVNAAGTLLVQFAQNAASGTSSVLVGSTFIVNQIA